jgi:hypothetical protein
MNDAILASSGRVFQRFVSSLAVQLTKPKAKFVRQLLCGILFSNRLVLTDVASRIPCDSKLTAIAKRLRRHLADSDSLTGKLWASYLGLLRRRLKINSLFIVDLTDLAKPYARKMEYLALVRDADKDRLVQGYWCMEVYCLDKDGIIWPVILWPYSLDADHQRSENAQILAILDQLDEHFGRGFGIYVFDRGFDRVNLMEPFMASKRHFIIRQRGDRMVVLANGVHIVLRELVEHMFAQSGHWLVYKMVYLPQNRKPLYVVAYRTAGYPQPVILLTDMVVDSLDLAGQTRNRFTRRWDCETSIEFLKSRIGLERFAVRRYTSMQRLIFLAGLAMAFLSYLQCCCKDIRRRINDPVRYCREPKSFWFYRLLIALQDAFFGRARRSLSFWCRPPPSSVSRHRHIAN